MATHIILPQNPDNAKSEFLKILRRDDETIVLILGDDKTAEDASDLAKEITEANEGDMGFFRFVNFVVAADPRPVIDALKEEDLKNLSGADLDNLEDFVIVSVSPFRNIISEAVTKTRFNTGPGSITTAIIAAIANG